MNRYIDEQLQRIGLYIKANKPINEYENDNVKIQLSHVNGKTNWLSLSDKQLEAIHAILSQE